MGGTLALGQANGLSDEYLDLGRELTHTCYQMYFRMPTKLSPEIVYFNQAPGASEDLIVKVSFFKEDFFVIIVVFFSLNFHGKTSMKALIQF